MPQKTELPIRLQFKSKNYYKDVLQCQGISHLIESKNLMLADGRDFNSGRTFINHDGSERLLVTLEYYGTSVTFKAAKELPPDIRNAAEHCGS